MTKHYILNRATGDIVHGGYPSIEAAETACEHHNWYDHASHEIVSGDVEMSFDGDDTHDITDFNDSGFGSELPPSYDHSDFDDSSDFGDSHDSMNPMFPDSHCPEFSDSDIEDDRGYYIIVIGVDDPLAGPFKTITEALSQEFNAINGELNVAIGEVKDNKFLIG